MRLFTTLLLPAEARDALAAAVADPPAGWRALDPRAWHVTLAFHGEDEPGPLARRLDGAARGLVAPRIRIAGAGAFDGVRWAGVEPASALTPLVAAAGGDVARFVAHVTVLRRRARPGRDADPDPPTPWAGHTGPWWRPAEVLLMASEPARGGHRHRPVHRVPLSVAAPP